MKGRREERMGGGRKGGVKGRREVGGVKGGEGKRGKGEEEGGEEGDRPQLQSADSVQDTLYSLVTASTSSSGGGGLGDRCSYHMSTIH